MTGLRVVLTGAESTGKTALAERLAAHFGAPWVPEYARAYAARRATGLTEWDIEPIARGQWATESRALLTGAPLVILDTDLLSTAVYARHYYGWCPAWIERAARSRSGLYLLCDPDIPWIPDPTRGPAERRRELHERFVAALEAAEIRSHLVSGSPDERFRTAIEVINALGRQDR